MPNYIRIYGTGMPIFITMVTHQRKPLLIQNFQHLTASINKVKKQHPFKLAGYVILPDHCHLLMNLSELDPDFSMRIRLIKTYFTQYLKTNYQHPIWQKRFWDHVIRDERDFITHLHYIHFNPVKHGYVKRVAEWGYSSFSAYVNKGVYDENWGDLISDDEFEIASGE